MKKYFKVTTLKSDNKFQLFPACLFIHIFQFGWLLLPDIAYLFYNDPGLPQASGLILITLSLLCVASLIAGSWKTFYLINLPLAFISGLVAAYIFTFQFPITIGLVHSILNTETRESLEVIQRYFTWVLFSLAGFTLYLYFAIFKINSIIIIRKYMAVFGVIGLFIVIYHQYMIFEIHERYNFVLNRTFISQAFPYNIFSVTRKIIADKHDKKEIHLGLPEFNIKNDGDKKIYVLVIGESVREQTFTEVAIDTGWIQNANNFIYFNDVLAQANFTTLSIDMLMKGAVYPDQIEDIPSLLHWQKAAKCTTAVISNNTTYDFNKYADISDLEGDSGVTHYTRFDHDMLPIVESLVINGNYDKLCITVHMVGSHTNYKARYQERFELYPVTGNKIEKMRAAYKNTIVSLQDFLIKLADFFDKVDADVLLAYTSDHGENLGEINNLIEHVTMTPTYYELKVPMIFWANSSYIKKNKMKWNKLGANNKLAISNAHLLPTLLDGMGMLQEIDNKFILPDSLFSEVTPMKRIYVTPDMEIHHEVDIIK